MDRLPTEHVDFKLPPRGTLPPPRMPRPKMPSRARNARVPKILKNSMKNMNFDMPFDDPFAFKEQQIDNRHQYTEFQTGLIEGCFKMLTQYTPCNRQRMIKKLQNSKDLKHYVKNQNLLKGIKNPDIGMALTIGSIALEEYL